MDLQNQFGLVHGRLFSEPPAYVNKQLLPGLSPIPRVSLTKWAQRAPFVLITSPNFVWACIALLVYFCNPYSHAVTDPISFAFLSERLPLWSAITFGYAAFWHCTLYGFQFASRPFVANRPYNVDKVVHNIFWTMSGVCIWTLFENVFCYLWTTGRLAYMSDAQSFGTVDGLLRFAFALAGIPVWRSLHFYFAHRFLHFGPMYQQVHSLHHRNTDTEPFSGLCMHPVEHLYYFACVAPSLIFLCSPFAFLWNGVHLLLSPAASHSGYEDHFQSDAFHYLHHRYFECNYAGSDASFLDSWFGTFREALHDKEGAKPREDAKSTLRSWPTPEFILYLLVSGSLFLIPHGGHVELFAILVGFGPVILAQLVSWMVGKGQHIKPVQMSVTGNLLHLGIGTLFCSVPVSYTYWLTFKQQ